MNLSQDTYGIAELQGKLLDILKYFIKLCEENELEYWLVGGTALGALRHGGFIPWDDDLDICMPREDYEKLWELYKDGCPDKQYKLCRTTLSKNYHHRVMQLVDTETTFINKRSVNEDIEHGLYIDVLPLDTMAPGKIKRLFQFFDAIIFSVFNIQNKAEYNGGKLTGVINFGTSLMLSTIRNPKIRYKIWKKAEKNMIKYANKESGDYVILTSAFRELFNIYPHECFEGERKAQFEDIEACIPRDAEMYCTKMYGDFMKLPPVEARAVKHNTVFIDLHNSYKKYKGIYYCVPENK